MGGIGDQERYSKSIIEIGDQNRRMELALGIANGN